MLQPDPRDYGHERRRYDIRRIESAAESGLQYDEIHTLLPVIEQGNRQTIVKHRQAQTL